MSLNNLSNKQLQDAIAHAKWSVKYDAEKVIETRQIESGNNLLTDLLGTSKRVDADVKAQELRNLEQSQQHLAVLTREAMRRGIDHESIPALSRKEGGQPA